MAGGAESEALKLRAFRAVLSDMMAVSKYSGLEERMGELEEYVKTQQGGETAQVSAVKSQGENLGAAGGRIRGVRPILTPI
jgi:hypothetical protein